MQPQLRRLEVEFAGAVIFRPVMGGLAREFGPALSVVGEWLGAGAASGMPVDARLWIESPPTSSYPACLAVNAAGEQGFEVQSAYLRVLRQGFACERRKLDGLEALVDVGGAVRGLDVARLRVDMGSNATAELLGADLERAEAAGERAGVEGRVPLPSLEFFDGSGEVVGAVYGFAEYEALRDAALAAGAVVSDDGRALSIEDALRRFGVMATPEVAAVCDLPGPPAAAELWRLAAEWRVRAETRVGGELWALA
jgi:hypothetical protein